MATMEEISGAATRFADTWGGIKDRERKQALEEEELARKRELQLRADDDYGDAVAQRGRATQFDEIRLAQAQDARKKEVQIQGDEQLSQTLGGQLDIGNTVGGKNQSIPGMERTQPLDPEVEEKTTKLKSLRFALAKNRDGFKGTQEQFFEQERQADQAKKLELEKSKLENDRIRSQTEKYTHDANKPYPTPKVGGGGKGAPKANVGNMGKVGTKDYVAASDLLHDTLSKTQNLIAEFSDDKAGDVVLGEVKNAIVKRLPKALTSTAAKDKANWWMAHEEIDAVRRNKLFGASLTTNEDKAWQAISVKPNSSPETVKKSLERRYLIIQNVAARKAKEWQALGVPEEVIDTKLSGLGEFDWRTHEEVPFLTGSGAEGDFEAPSGSGAGSYQPQGEAAKILARRNKGKK